ncbi:MAG: hypothetical protein OEV37_00395 [Candidatus Berkelbacteria bacterium]|nr:hypothetical protein [Candidatus Berkelbacteria bacterium]
MFARLNSKVVLIVVGVISVIIIVIVFAVIQGRRTQEEAASQDEPIQTDEPLTYEQLPQPSGGGGAAGATLSPSPTISGVILQPIPSPAAAMSIGDLDWTKIRPSPIATVSLDENVRRQIAGKTLCQLSGLKDSWDNPLEKMVCNAFDFFNNQIIGPLNYLNCLFASSALQANYSPDIKVEYKNGECIITDRK